ncbi:MAG: nucleoside phosphorylase [Bacteroidia bacterium]|nr:nucleoside phosphorylase [Bacteroidia bacterium]
MKSTELILNADTSVYHLNLLPSDIAETIILVGDPNRVARVAERFDFIELTKGKREFQTITGSLSGHRITVISTGIGTDNIDIVLNELDALANIDFRTRTVKEHLKSLKIIRMGTCGGLQAQHPPGTLVLSHASIGLDALMPFYVTQGEGVFPFEAAARKVLGDFPRIAALAYGARGDQALSMVASESFPDVVQGITFTAPGFYGPQGRSLGRVPVALPALPDLMATVSAEGLTTLNMEMETSGILALGRALGHQCGSLSVILANRPTGVFHPDPAAAVDQLIDRGLELVSAWIKS